MARVHENLMAPPPVSHGDFGCGSLQRASTGTVVSLCLCPARRWRCGQCASRLSRLLSPYVILRVGFAWCVWWPLPALSERVPLAPCVEVLHSPRCHRASHGRPSHEGQDLCVAPAAWARLLSTPRQAPRQQCHKWAELGAGASIFGGKR